MGAFNYLKYRKFDKFSPDFYFAKNENFPKRGFKVKPKPSSCAVCSLMKLGVGYAEGSGNGTNKIMLVGEALGAREAQLGVPFVGEAGVQLNRTLERVPMGRQEFRITNAVRCRPPKNWLDGAPWEADALMNCSQYFEEELQRYKPKVVVSMGNIPTKLLLGDGVKGKGGIERRRGYVYECTYGEHNFHVIPTYHPAFIMRGQQKLTDVQAIDINRAIRVMRNGYKEPPYNYIEHPTLPDAWNYYEKCVIAAGNGMDLAADIETPNSGGAEEDEYGDIIDTDIIRISFSYEPHTAITIPFTYAYLSVIEAILALPWRYTVFWNQEFDVPRLKSKGMTIGKVLDAMYMWHFLQSNLPKGLGYVSTFFTELREWKSLSMEQPEYYSCVDADATIQNHIKIKSLLESQGRFEMFREHYIELHPIATMMARSGMPIDIEQQQKFRKEIDNELRRVDEAVQAVLPDAVKPFVARRKIPADADIGRAVEGRKGGGVWGVNSDGEWGIRMPFLCNSPKQVVAYMRYQGHAVPTNYKTGNPTTSADEIEKLADKYPDDPLYARIIQTREYKKIIGQYVDGYVPDPDGLVRTHFNRKPSTWRWNCVAGDTKITTSRGEFSIEEYEVEEGDTILTHTGRLQRVLRKFRNGVEEMVLVRLSNDCCIKCTGEHTLLTPQGWRRVKDITVGSEVYSVTQTRQGLDEDNSRNVHSSREANNRGGREEVWHLRGDCTPGVEGSVTPRTVQGREEITLLQKQDELQKPYAREDCREAPQLEGRVQRQQGESNEGSEWKKGVCTQGSVCRSVGDSGGSTSQRDGRASFGWGPIEQRLGEPVFVNGAGSYTITQQEVSSLTSVGPMEVWDIEVEEDHSYVAQGFINHNSEAPNVQNVLKRGDFAKEYRKQFVALPGYTLVEMDYKALEAQLVGVFAEDKEYVKAAKLGVHSILMARVQGIKINLDSPPNEVKKVLKALKTADPVMYDSCKHVVHGSNYLGTPRRLRIGWPDLFPSVGAAKKIQDLYFSTLARKVRRWQQDVLNLAYHQHFLEGPYGYRHYFWDVLHYVGKQLEWGTDAKKAVAFLPQSTGAGLISEAILRIYRQFPEVFKWLKWMIHDSLIAMVPNSELSYGIGVMKACMEYPEKRLDGLSVEVEIEVGKNWGELHEYDGEITPITIRS